jgi:hypothetical protein
MPAFSSQPVHFPTLSCEGGRLEVLLEHSLVVGGSRVLRAYFDRAVQEGLEQPGFAEVRPRQGAMLQKPEAAAQTWGN